MSRTACAFIPDFHAAARERDDPQLRGAAFAVTGDDGAPKDRDRIGALSAAARQAGVREGTFARCDAWEVANIFWTVANGLIRSEHVAARRRLRRSRLDRIFEDAIELLLRGISVARPAP